MCESVIVNLGMGMGLGECGVVGGDVFFWSVESSELPPRPRIHVQFSIFITLCICTFIPFLYPR